MASSDRKTQPLNRSAAQYAAIDSPGHSGERRALLASSGALIVYGLARRTWGGLALALVGGALLYRSIAHQHETGEIAGIKSQPADRQPNQPPEQHSGNQDPVMETSEESFPASDPPAWIGSRLAA